MNPRICRCCGEPIHEEGNILSRNPNVCASCSSMSDGMTDDNVPACDGNAPDQSLRTEAAAQSLHDALDDRGLEPVTHPVSTEA